MTPKRSCPICAHNDVEALHTQKFELPNGHPLSEGYNIVVCLSCGFVYADTSVTQADYDRFYKEYSKYEDTKTGTGGVDNPFDWKRQQETARQINDVLQNTNAAILDVGCANGGMLKALMELGYKNLCGIDPSPVCVANTKNLGIEAFQGSLFLPFKENAYDCVILSHTLEHIQDVSGAIDWINNRLRPGGIVYIETPDAARYVDFIYAPFQDFNTEHINHFSLTCLQNAMGLSGFTYKEGAIKDLKINEQMYYPAAFGFWQKPGNAIPFTHKNDSTLRAKIEEYISRSTQMMREIDAQVSAILEKTPSIIVWGTGQLAMKLLIETSLSRAEIIAFVDNNPINQGKILHGKLIVPPSEVSKWDAPILITTLLHHHSIAQQVREMGINNKIFFLQGEAND